MKIKVFRMHVEMENAAFEDNPNELQRVVSQAAKTVDTLPVGAKYPLYDTNGNKVGFMEITTARFGG